MDATGVTGTESERISVAEARDTDTAAIASFLWEAWRSSGANAPGWAGASEEAILELTTPEAIRARIGGPVRRMFLAWEGDRVVGFSATRAVDDAAIELAGLIVLPDMLGRGVGTPLLETAVSSARDAGFRRVLVKTETTNERALGFYRRRGFSDSRVIIEDVEGTPMELAELIRTL